MLQKTAGHFKFAGGWTIQFWHGAVFLCSTVPWDISKAFTAGFKTMFDARLHNSRIQEQCKHEFWLHWWKCIQCAYWLQAMCVICALLRTPYCIAIDRTRTATLKLRWCLNATGWLAWSATLRQQYTEQNASEVRVTVNRARECVFLCAFVHCCNFGNMPGTVNKLAVGLLYPRSMPVCLSSGRPQLTCWKFGNNYS